MTIEAGALALRISEVGGDQVLAKLTAIDAKAKAVGTATTAVKFNAASATAVNGQLQQLGNNFTRVTAAADAATPALLRQAQAQATVAKTAASVGAQTTGLTRAASGFTAMAASIGAMGVVLSVGALVSGLVNMTRDAIDLGDALHDLSMRTGVAVEELSVLMQVAEKSGANSQMLGVGLRNLSREVEKLRAGNKGATEAFAAIGLSARDLDGLSIEQVFIKVADAQAKLGDGSEKTAAMLKLFGRAGDQLIPMLNELADGGFDKAREKAVALGGVVSTDFADKADKFNDTVSDMTTAIGGLARALAEESLPWMTRLGEKLTDLIVKSRSWAGALVDAAAKAGLLMFLGPGGAGLVSPRGTPGAGPTVTFTPTLSPEARAAQLALLDGRAGTTRTPLTAAQREAAEAARIQRSLDRMKVGPSQVTDIVGESQLGDMMALIPKVGVDSKGNMKGVPAFGLEDVVDKGFDALSAKIAQRREQLGELLAGVGMTIGDALASGFTAAFTGGNFFAEMGKALLAGIGSMLVQLGSAMLTYGLLMAVGLPLLIATPFAAQALSAPAAIAAGTGLIALGAGMGALAGGGKGGGGGGGGSKTPQQPQDNEWSVAFDPDRKLRGGKGSAVAPAARSLDGSPMPEARPVVQIGSLYALNPDDARWQRELASTYKNARDRGLIRNG